MIQHIVTTMTIYTFRHTLICTNKPSRRNFLIAAQTHVDQKHVTQKAFTEAIKADSWIPIAEDAFGIDYETPVKLLIDYLFEDYPILYDHFIIASPL